MVYRSLLRPILFRLPAETAHHLALTSLSLLKPRVINRLVAQQLSVSPFGTLERFGLHFSNPVGLAGGFDKDGVALQALAALGFGFIEAGTVTFRAQPGNPLPRLFRLPLDRALINRAGFNNAGAETFARNVEGKRPTCVLGVSIGKSKITPLEDAVDDYLASFDLVYPVADYVAVNVSSPNTPQLRELQQSDQLESLLKSLKSRGRELQSKFGKDKPVPLLVKLSPDLDDNELRTIVDVIKRVGIDGIIATNTTITRTNLQTPVEKVSALGAGGLSGQPLKRISTRMIARLFQLTGGQVPLIGVGGIFTAEDAWEKIQAGASLIQVYTGMIYQGPAIARDINEGLAAILEREGIPNLDDAVGIRANELA
jgi:dihydroorotate dehydrogenase